MQLQLSCPSSTQADSDLVTNWDQSRYFHRTAELVWSLLVLSHAKTLWTMVLWFLLPVRGSGNSGLHPQPLDLVKSWDILELGTCSFSAWSTKEAVAICEALFCLSTVSATEAA